MKCQCGETGCGPVLSPENKEVICNTPFLTLCSLSSEGKPQIVSISFCKMPSDSMVLIQGNHCCLGYRGVFTGLPVLGHREIPLTGYPGIALLHE